MTKRAARVRRDRPSASSGGRKDDSQGYGRLVLVSAVWLSGVYMGMIVSTSVRPWLSDRSSNLERRLVEAESTISLLRQKLSRVAAPPSSVSHMQSQYGICQRLMATGSNNSLVPSATSLWMHHLRRIHASSRLAPNDRKYYFHDFTAQLLHMVSTRLPLSTVTLPESNWQDAVPRILDKVERRYKYLESKFSPLSSSTFDKTPPPPVTILVLGGSVLVGRNCRTLCTQLGLQIRMPQRECTFAYRLEQFLNRMVTSFFTGRLDDDPDHLDNREYNDNDAQIPKLFKVVKVAMGGTNTNVGVTIMKYGLVPEEARTADIVLNAYATNDMHILTQLEADNANQTLRDKVLNMTQSFVRTVWSDGFSDELDSPSQEISPDTTAKCADHSLASRKRPLLLFLDDYLGNEQRSILDTAALPQSLATLATYYGFGM
jgi:hypothetical protein